MKIIPLIILGFLVSFHGNAQQWGLWGWHPVRAANLADTTTIYKNFTGTWIETADTSHYITFGNVPESRFRQYSLVDELGPGGNDWLLDSIAICTNGKKLFYIDFYITESMVFYCECTLDDDDTHLVMTFHKGEEHEKKTEYKRKS